MDLYDKKLKRIKDMGAHSELPLMIDLQRIYDIITSARESISRSEKSIAYWNQRVDELKEKISVIDKKLKDLNVSTKTRETNHQELADKLKKLDETRLLLKNEKELSALTAQIDSVKQEYDGLETLILNELEEIDRYQTELQEMSDELAGLEKTVAVDIEKLERDISEKRELMENSQSEFDTHSENLSPAIKLKFKKMLHSSGGKSLVPLEGDVCSACHFKQPPSIQTDMSDSGSIHVCVSCSRYIYKKE